MNQKRKRDSVSTFDTSEDDHDDIKFDEQPTLVTVSVCHTDDPRVWKDVHIILVYINQKRWFVHADLKNIRFDCELRKEARAMDRRVSPGVETFTLKRPSRGKITKLHDCYEYLASCYNLSRSNPTFELWDADALKWTVLMRPVLERTYNQ